MKKWGALSVVVLLAVVGAGYLETRSYPGDQGLSDRIAAEVQRGTGTMVDLEKLAPFHWTDLYVFGPYTDETMAEQRMHRPWHYRWSAVGNQDDRAFLVFLDSGRVIAAFDQFLDRGDFSYYGHSPRTSHLTPTRAKFRVWLDPIPLNNGRPHFLLELLE
jgi:hypothetical protein